MECNNASEWCFDLSLNFYSESHPEAHSGLKSKKKVLFSVCINGLVEFFFSLRKENIKKDLFLASVW